MDDVHLFLESLQELKVTVPQLGEREQQLQHGLRAHMETSLLLLPATPGAPCFGSPVSLHRNNLIGTQPSKRNNVELDKYWSVMLVLHNTLLSESTQPRALTL